MQFEYLEGIEFYTLVDNDTKVFAEYVVPSADEKSPDILMFVDIDSPKFASFLRKIVIPTMDGKITSDMIIRDIHDDVNVFGCDDVINPKVRTAGKLEDDTIEYALYDRKHQYIKISRNGWSIASKSENKFTTNAMSVGQVEPQKTNENLIDLMRPYLNTDDDSMLLTIAWMVRCFCEGDKQALLVSAPSGSGKSVLTEIMRKIIDPAKTNISTLNSKGDNLLTALTNSYLVAFDNTRELSMDESDTMCIAVTGGTYSKREAFSTNTNAVFHLHNAIIINGIDIIPRESDFAQRCLLLTLKSLNSKNRLLKNEIINRFDKELPYILGAIFNTISKAMQIIRSVKIAEKTRMADAEIEMTAIALALGISQNEFKRIIEENKNKLDKARSKTDLIFAVQEYLTKINGKSIEGTVSQIYAKICNNYSGGKSALPKTPSHFSRKLSSEYHAFLSAGIRINLDDTYSDGTHIKIIKKQ